MIKSIKKYINNPYKVFPLLAAKGCLTWMSDDLAAKLIYRGWMNTHLNLEKPETFNEKLQWLKIYDRNPLYTKLVDKYQVRDYIKQWLGDEYLIPLLGIWETPEEIDFQLLPDAFVLKCTHDSGSAIVCRNKSELNISVACKNLKKRISKSHYWAGLEWPYKNVRPRIIAEDLLSDGNEKGLTDYKFFCFNGIPKFLYISSGLENHETAYISYYDFQGNKMPFRRSDYCGFPTMPEMPSKLNEMIQIAEKCAKKIGVAFVRVDLYQINERIYFSEFTFTPGGGYTPFVPNEYDKKIGEMLHLPIEE